MLRSPTLVRILVAGAMIAVTAVARSELPVRPSTPAESGMEIAPAQSGSLRRVPVALAQDEQPAEKPAEDLPKPTQDPTEALIKSGVLPPQSSRESRPAVPTVPDHSYEARSEEAFDAVGSYDDPAVIGPRSRPIYPYGHNDYWPGQEANVESWGDLLELPHVRLGWFADAEATAFRPHVNAEFSSGTLLDGTFPGSPVHLPPGGMNWDLMPKIEVGYHFEHGLGDIRAAYFHVGAQGNDPLPSFDSAGLGVLSTSIRLDVFDLDCFGSLEFNSQGMPLIMPLFLAPARLGLGKSLTPGILVPPLEMRWFFGLRYADLRYNSVGRGDLLEESNAYRFLGAGLHFGIDLNQHLPCEAPIFLHIRTEGSGIFGLQSEQFSRSVAGGPTATGGFGHDGIGVPSVNLELGFAYVPHWPSRDVRLTLAYQYQEWFSWATTDISHADLILNGILVRGEYKF